MFPLAGKEFPDSVDELQRAINDALARVFVLPAEDSGAKLN